jgi:hypothetical protein
MSIVKIRSVIGKLIRRTGLRWYIPNKMTRMEVIQYAIDSLGARNYLEIGVSDGTCFCELTVAKKIGVDPITAMPRVALEASKPGARYFALTSDDFFNQVAPQVLADGADVVFIDGLHTYVQAYQDCMNSLKYLNPDGLVLMHDCLPKSPLEARVAPSYYEAKKLNDGFVWNGDWVGDVWKAVVRLRSQHKDLSVCVINCDHGIGLVYRDKDHSGLEQTSEQIDMMRYADLATDTRRLLGLRSPSHLQVVVEKLRTRREFSGAQIAKSAS